MGIHDRDYIRTRRRGYDGPSSPMGWPFNTWLIVANVAVFVLGMLFAMTGLVKVVDLGVGRGVPMTLDQALGHFSTAKAFFYQTTGGAIIFGLQFWRFITFQFLHANLVH